MKPRSCFFFVVLLAALGPFVALADLPAGIVQIVVGYGPDPQQKLDMCLPLPNPSKPMPALVMIHGGAWKVGSRLDWGDVCQIAAASGLAAVAIDYRLADGTPPHSWPAQLVDVQLAVRWVRANADRYHIDPRHICAMGDSAGGHLTVFLATLDRIAPGDYAGELAGISPKIDCAIDWFGPVDLSGENARYPNMSETLSANVSPGGYAEAERSASPLSSVNASTSPMLIVQGTNDAEVDLDQSQRLHQALTVAGVPNQLWLYKGGHEFKGAKDRILGFVEASIAFAKNPLTFLRDNHPPPVAP